MCVEVVTEWPCGHSKSDYEFCAHAQPKRLRIVFVRAPQPTGARPLEPCAEPTRRTVRALLDTRCPDVRCKERISWMCCQCPALPEAVACSVDYTVKQGRPDRAPYAVMSRAVLASLNAGFSCGSSDTGSAHCGHDRCSNCLTWRRCRCGCNCRHMTPVSRRVCRPCMYATCRGRRQKQDKASQALEIAIANLKERTGQLTLVPKKEEKEQQDEEEDQPMDSDDE